MAASKGPPPKQAKVNVDALLKQWESDKKSRIFLQLAEAYRKQDSLDAAISVLREGLKHHSAFAPAHVALARCLLGKGQLAQAQAELEPIFKRSPDNLLAGKLLAQVLQERGERQRALEVVDRLSPFAPDDEELADRRALLKAELGGSGAPRSESTDTAEFSTSDFTGESSRPVTASGVRPGSAVPPEPAMAAEAPPLGEAPMLTEAPPLESRWAPVAASGVSRAVPESHDDEVIEIVDDADEDDEVLDADELPAASLPPIPRPSVAADDLLGDPLQEPIEGTDDEFTSITLAELYEAQGGHREAAAIYASLLLRRPGDAGLERALARCQARERGQVVPEPLSDVSAPPPAPPPRPRWEPVRPREFSATEPEPDQFSTPMPQGSFSSTAPTTRAGRLREERRQLRRWLAASQAARTVR